MTASLNDADKALIRAFVVREAADFGDRWAPEHVDTVTSLALGSIERELGKGKAEHIIIESLGNTGCTLRELKIDAPNGAWEFQAGEVRVTLCTCGKVNCWGSAMHSRFAPTHSPWEDES